MGVAQATQGTRRADLDAVANLEQRDDYEDFRADVDYSSIVGETAKQESRKRAKSG